MKEEKEPKIVGFLCNWCSYAGADLAGTSRIQMPSNVRVIRVMCSSRVKAEFVLKAFKEGADGVLIAGCHPGECHYMEGNYHTRRRFAVLKKLLEYVGVDPRRLRVEWVSASEGIKFKEVVEEMSNELKELGKLELQ
ncbi:MAG: methyl-viologen-reducing hydrogenase subunit delta [Candidatus Altiarchaeales archaeon WOR_SM1_86-2]|nr:MAG: methyl-viologen-reducing hydrogenase subunit delta [Candidatus Altiarchaeales archaeon WOR_SM1_86-2]ODS40133.1 MAG: methyl-viologen-reducing hydrogenase subunit delta [Candidatus Altiarchaeales archaeon WOR_SM1_79]